MSNFPSNPSTGATYSIGINRWVYNGSAWNKLDNHPEILGGNQISINYFESLTGGATFQVNVIEGKGSDLDADLIHGVSGSRFLEHLQSGLLYGATLAVNAGNTAYFDLSAGAGIIVNFGATLSNYPNPTVSIVTWPSRTGLTAQYIATHNETWLSIDSSGNIIQQATKWSDQQYESRIPIGVLVHPNHSTINLAVDIPKLSYGNATQVDPFMRAFGPLKLSGHEISANGANLQVNKSSGTAFLLGRNYTTDPNYANVVTDTNATPISTIYHYYRDVSGEFITTTSSFIDPTKYDDGSGTLATAPSGKYTTQRLFFLPGTPTVLAAYYGREIYNSIETAQANIQFESFSEDDSTATLGVFGGYLIVKANATALNNSADAKFISSGIFRNLANIGGGGVAVAGLDDLTDVVITSASNNQVLKYESGFWINSGLTSSIGNYVTTFNGLTGNVTGVESFNGSTGAIVGVNSIRGLTGVVGITNGSGIGLSVSGQTMTFSNTGVLSIDGGTGAITYVARTNVANTFTASQTIEGLGRVLSINDANANIFTAYSSQLEWYNDLSSTSQYWVPSPGPNPSTITFPNENGTIALTKNVVSSFNGLTGAIFGVNSIRGLTGVVGITNGSGIGLSVSGQTMTFSNTGVLSIDGSTGAITNVARTNVYNIFSASQKISTANAALSIVDSSSLNEVSFEGEFNRLYFYNDLSGGEVFFGPTIAPASTITVSLPAFTTTLAGLAGTQTFTGTNTFSALTNFPGGISAAGATFSSLVRFNAGISAAGGTLSSIFNIPSGGITLQTAISTGNDRYLRISPTEFKIGTTQTPSNNGVIQLNYTTTIDSTSVPSYYGTVPLIVKGSATPSPTTANLTEWTVGTTTYASITSSGGFSGAASRFSGLITANAGISAAGGTFGSLVRFNAGISAAGGVTFSGTIASDTGYRITSNAINAQTGTTYTFLDSDNGKVVTFNNGSTTTVTIPTGLPVGFNCTAIQLGAGQVGFTAASGVTMNAYASAYKISGQHGAAALISYTTNIFNLSGTLSV